MKIKGLSLLFLIATSLFFCTTIMAQSSVEQSNAISVTSTGSTLKWDIKVPFSSVTLAVTSPNGETFQQEFLSGVTPAFELTGKRSKLVNGTYIFEVRVNPVIAQEVKDALAKARAAGNEEAVQKELKSLGMIPNPINQAGSFAVDNRNVYVKGDGLEEAENPKPARASGKAKGTRANAENVNTTEDVVNPDDFIVQGSLCVGFDCVDNESFGFDTIRLKENNTRIKFEDTSTSAGFASTDWQLTANDSASGGANKFSIEDVTAATVPFTILGGAPTNSMFVGSNGKLGLGTSTPGLDIHKVSTDTPAIRLEQTNGGGFTAQTWDIGANEANFFVRDLTGGSRLPFRIRPGAPTSSLDIGADGVVTFTKGFRFYDSVSGTYTSVQSAPAGGDSGYSLHIMGSTGAVAKSGQSLFETNLNNIGFASGQTGNFLVRYNLPVTENFISSGGEQTVYKIRYRDTDAGSNARIRIFLYTSDINTGNVTFITLFDSITQSTGSSYSTATICVPTNSMNLSYASQGSWIEVKLARQSATEEADFSQMQVYRAATCPQ